MKHLTFKTVALVGLISAQRSQALAALGLKDMSVSEDRTRFCVSRLLKISRPGKSSTPIMVPKNTWNSRLCSHTTLQTYISRTDSVRNPVGTDSIFISLCSPFMAVGSPRCQDGSNLFSVWRELIRPFTQVTAFEALLRRKQAAWGLP